MRDPMPRDLSVDEYLRREARAEVRHEYVAGHVHAMTGATARHNRILRNIAIALNAAAATGSCEVFISDMKVNVHDDTFYYPDLVVTCVRLDDDAVYTRTPCLVVEVTSPSTRATDRREKLLGYGRLPSVQAYLVVDHRRRRVWHYAPDAAGQGLRLRHEIAGDGEIDVPCPQARLTLATIYDCVTLPAVGERTREGYNANSVAGSTVIAP